ncbi:TPR repeat-containing protein [Desulfonauticus submarinus]|uniref:TPR repeat-containing protein n=1 Tax=Desulfonauticus submarinus TaxID=206665 RepID=A0A1G9ZJJ1_9BACT|nr:tetratricopeptide repeat protein [Desulfonauticus submarinus]SDN20683.1 TPR repeat-containing protein [Desulfonauticus submarinus]
MSASLIQARQKLNSIQSLLKQNKVLAGVQALYDGILGYIKQPLMNNEKKELAELISKDLYYLNQNPKLREIYPVLIEYKPGEEKKLLETLKELLEILQEGVTQVAQEKLAQLEAQKQKELAKAKQHLEEKNIQAAEKIYDHLINKFQNDTKLKIEISDQLIEAEAFEKSLKYLKLAYREDPESIHIFNRLGIALRKLGRYKDAEKAYLHAIKIDPNDAYLYFNLARVYLDAKDMEKAKNTVKKALNLKPDFDLAQKMLKFIEKNI